MTVTWDPKRARAAALQVCGMFLMRPDDTEAVVTTLASAALYNQEAFRSEENFRAFMKTALSWSDAHMDSLLGQMAQDSGETADDKQV